MDVVFDIEEVNTLTEKCKAELDFSQSVVDNFLKIMDQVCSHAIIQGQAHEAFLFIVTSMKLSFSNIGSFKVAGQNLGEITKSFLTEIDIADDFMY